MRTIAAAFALSITLAPAESLEAASFLRNITVTIGFQYAGIGANQKGLVRQSLGLDAVKSLTANIQTTCDSDSILSCHANTQLLANWPYADTGLASLPTVTPFKALPYTQSDSGHQNSFTLQNILFQPLGDGKTVRFNFVAQAQDYQQSIFPSGNRTDLNNQYFFVRNDFDVIGDPTDPSKLTFGVRTCAGTCALYSTVDDHITFTAPSSFSESGSYDNAEYRVTSLSLGFLDGIDAAAPSKPELAQMADKAYTGLTAAEVGKFEAIGSIGVAGDPSSVYAIVYRSAGTDGGRDQIVVSIRGSKNYIDFLQRDGSFLGSGGTQAFKQGATQIASELKDFVLNHPDADFTFTGHSLGGAYAESLGALLQVNAVGFNAPGASGLLDAATAARIKDLVGTIYSQDQGVANVRNYGDLVSLLGAQPGEVFTMLPSQSPSNLTQSLIDKHNTELPGFCVYRCHEMAEIIGGYQLDNAVASGLVDPYGGSIPVIYQPIVDALGGLKTFKTLVAPNIPLLFDPSGSGDRIYVNLLDSSTWITGFILPSPGEIFPIFGRNAGAWESLGSFEGMELAGVGRFSQYYIGNASHLIGKEGDFYVGMTFGQAGTFSASLSTIGPSGVPEPMTWALLFVGFAAVGVAKRRGNRLQGSTEITLG